MEFTKAKTFTPHDRLTARYAKALAHPARVAILRLLAQRTSCFCGDIVGELTLAQSTVSQHLKELKEAGLIQGTISGTSVCYCIDAQEWASAQRTLLELLTSFREAHANCCAPTP